MFLKAERVSKHLATRMKGDPLLLPLPSLSHEIGRGEVSLSSIVRSNALVLPASIARLFRTCRGLNTFQGFAENCLKSLSTAQRWKVLRPIIRYYEERYSRVLVGPDWQKAMLAGIFEVFAKEDLFISFEEWASTLEKNRAQRIGSASQISTVGIITCHRPESLKRSTFSYMANCQKFERRPTFDICDDSKDSKMIAENKYWLCQAQKKYGLPVHYVGLDEKRQMKEVLVKADIPDELAEFTLFDTENSHYSYGANCNALYLKRAGEMFFVTDDDTVCQLTRSPDYRAISRWGGHENPLSVWFFKDREKTLESCSEVQVDFLSEHESWLGRHLCDALQEPLRLNQMDLSEIGASAVFDVLQNRGQIVLTHNGLFGDSGSNSPRAHLFSRGAQLDRLLQSEDHYRQSFESREILKVASSTTLVPAQVCMSTFYGADNREPLPPFLPMYRDCDSVFGFMNSLIQPDHYYAHLPLAHLHDPPEQRRYFGVESSVNEWLAASTIVILALKTFKPVTPSLGRVEGLKRVGQMLIDLGSLPFGDYQGLVLNWRKQERAEECGSLELALAAGRSGPAFWKRDIEKLRELSRDLLTKPLALAPPPMVKTMGQIEAERFVQLTIKKFGQLVFWWPEMHQTFKSLQGQFDFSLREN